MQHQQAGIPRVVWPEGIYREPVPAEVPAAVAKDFREAVLVLPYSPNASAALSRRCLQGLLTERGFTGSNLVDQIKAAKGTMPAYIAASLDPVRLLGNLAAHPTASQLVAAEIVDVDPRAALAMIEVIEDLFDFYFALPERCRARRGVMTAALAPTGKKPPG